MLEQKLDSHNNEVNELKKWFNKNTNQQIMEIKLNAEKFENENKNMSAEMISLFKAYNKLLTKHRELNNE